MLIQQKYVLGTPFLKEVNKPAKIRVEWTEMDCNGGVSSKTQIGSPTLPKKSV